MLHYSNFDDVACITNGITVTNPAMVARIRGQVAHLSDYDIAAHLSNAIASSTDAAHALAWEQSQLGEACAETLVASACQRSPLGGGSIARKVGQTMERRPSQFAALGANYAYCHAIPALTLWWRPCYNPIQRR